MLFLISYRNLLFVSFCRVVFDEWQKSVVRNILQSCFWWVAGICCSQHSAELFLMRYKNLLFLMSARNLLFASFCRVSFMRYRNLLFATFCRVVIDEWQKSVVRNILQSCFWWMTEICCSQHFAELFLMSYRNLLSAELCLMSDIMLLFATLCRVVFDEWQKSFVRNDINLLFTTFWSLFSVVSADARGQGHYTVDYVMTVC